MRTASLALVLLAVAACSDDQTDPPPLDQDVAIVSGASTLGATAYDPNPFTISLAVQATVEWRNLDGVNHTVTADDASFSSADITPTASYSKIFTSPGTYPYHCAIHPGMVGSIVVTP
jgi:plastocyanin